MEIRLLGPLEVRDGGVTFALPRRQQRALLAALALRAGEVVSTDRLATDLWGERPPASATGSLQNAVYALRQVLGEGVLVTQAPGYRLAVRADDVDAKRFERLVGEAGSAEPARRASLLSEAIALWRGPALADLDELDFARLEAARLDELYVNALEERLEAELGLGRHGVLVGELEALVAAHPLRERLRGQLMLALYRSGRQAEALEVYRAARLALADELGLDPTPELQELERRILRQDPSLAAPAAPAGEAPPAPAERRLVSVLVAIPPPEEDPERLRQLLDDVLESARRTLERHRGELVRFGPEALVAVFGAERPGDDDARHAAAAAEELGLPAGVATGEAVGGAGAVFVRAAELARGPGLQLDARTHELVHATPRHDAPLVGRGEELGGLERALAAAVSERGCRVVTVIGEPGIGKSRLARELVRQVRGATEVLVGRCLSFGDRGTFAPLQTALRDVDAAEALQSEPDAALVLARLALLADGTQAVSLGEAYWAVRRLLEALARRRPVLFVLDDLHWAEPGLLDLVDYLADRADGPLVVLCLARPELERALGAEIVLEPLENDHMRLFVEALAELGDEKRAEIVELAEGNPLFGEQLAAYAAAAGEGLPPTLEAVLAGRLGQLEPAERTVLQRAAVFGREFTRGGATALLDAPPDTELASLRRRGFIRPAADAQAGDDAYRFHHVLLRDAAYAALTKRDRAALHEGAAAWLDRDDAGDDALVGYHLEQASDLRRSMGEAAEAIETAAGERLGRAAMRVWRQNDARAAVGLLRRATTLLPAGERRAQLLCELWIAERLLDGDSDALDRAAGDARLAKSAALDAWIALERALLAFGNGDASAAELLETSRRSLDVLEAAGDSRAASRAWLAAVAVHEWACRYADATAAAERAVEAYERASFSPAAANLPLSFGLLYGPVHVTDAIARCSEIRTRADDRLSRAHATSALGGLAALEERFEEARLLCDEARAIYEDLGAGRMVHMGWGAVALLVARRAGELDAAAAIARAAFGHFSALDDRPYASTWAARLAEVLYWSGLIDAAADAADAARRRAVQNDVYVQFLWRSTAAKVAARNGSAEEAEQLSVEALQLAAASDSPLLLADLWLARAEVLRLGGRSTEAAGAAAGAQALLRKKGDAAGVAEVERLLSPTPTESPSGLSV